MDKKPTTAEIVIMASGAVALIFSFFDFYSFDSIDGSVGYSAWSSSLFPLATYMAIIGVILGVQVALRAFSGMAMPERILGFTWQQIHLILAFFAVLIGIGYLIVDIPGRAVGFWLMFIGSIGMLVGAVLEMNEAKSAGPGRA